MSHFRNNLIMSYFPSQPEILKFSQYYVEQKPTTNLSKEIVVKYYQFKTNKKSTNKMYISPDGTYDILFCCDPNNPISYLWTSKFKRIIEHDLKNDCEYFGIRFYPNQQLINFSYPMNELLNQKVPISDIIPSFDPFIAERISEAETFQQRIRISNQFIEKIQMNNSTNQLIAKYAIGKVYKSNGLITMESLSKELGYSDRYIRQKFQEYIGYSPKQFSLIVRFQIALGIMLRRRENHDFSDIYFGLGFHDQAHFIKSFKSFTNQTPKEFVNTFFNEG